MVRSRWSRQTATFDRLPVDLSTVDTLNIFAMLLLSAIVAILHRSLGDLALGLLATFAILILCTTLLASLSSRGRAWAAVHEFSSIVTVIAVFSALGPVIARANPERWDITFARLDASLFGQLAGEWRGLLGRPPWFVDFTYVLYLSYYFVPFVLGIIVYRRQSTQEFRSLAFTIVLTFYLSYVGYFLFPTLGPRVPPQAESLAIGGGALSEAARRFLAWAEHNPTDAFPSGHTAVALLCLFRARRVPAALSRIYVPLVTGIIFSTVYLHSHYVVDVLAGAALACAGAWLGPRVEPWCEPRGMVKRLSICLGMG
jgi:membrane-associated phospholipid phosphatase